MIILEVNKMEEPGDIVENVLQDEHHKGRELHVKVRVQLLRHDLSRKIVIKSLEPFL